ncbi:translation repressor protein [Xanthomonas phage X1]|nr:translation repressor protein [Xanthomonas phage X1]
MSQNRKQELLESFFEIEPLNKDQFLKVRETLTRIGLPSKRNGDQTLWQTCHVFHKQGRYYIVHFKQLFLLDGRTDVTDFTDEDEDRLEFIVNLLEQWGLVTSLVEVDARVESNVMIIPYRDKHKWSLRVKYSLGNTDNGES